MDQFDDHLQHPLAALRTGDTAVLENLFHQYRETGVNAVEEAGGNHADGATFFRVALLHTALMAQDNKLDEDTDLASWLPALAADHFRDWVSDKDSLPESADEAPQAATVSADEMDKIRHYVRVRRTFDRLPEPEKAALSVVAHSSDQAAELSAVELDAISRFRSQLGAYGENWTDPMPQWAVYPLVSPSFDAIWKKLDQLERQSNHDKAAATDNGVSFSGVIKYVFAAFLFLFAGNFIYNHFFRPKTTKEVFQANFIPPPSILEDLAKHPVISPDDSIEVNRPETCDAILREADEAYKKAEWRTAARTLSQLLDTEEFGVCQSEALFYIGIIGLKTGDPYLSLQCFAKIEDLERFGEDMYWYQALAYMRIAMAQPEEKETAVRAIERALSNTRVPERREQCEKMLEQLNK